VQRSGDRPGFRKPHYSYEPTVAAEQLFPKVYGPLLNRILAALKQGSGPDKVTAVLRNVGRALVTSRNVRRDATLDERLQQVLTTGTLTSESNNSVTWMDILALHRCFQQESRIANLLSRILGTGDRH
jgi:predicted ArsR family transcriptional regulator